MYHLHKLGVSFQITYYDLCILNDHETKESTLPREWNEMNKNINRVEKRSMIDSL